MIGLRSTTLRVLSRQNSLLSCRTRSFHAAIPSTTRVSLQRSSAFQLQRRFASQDQTQSEPEADGAQGQHGDNSIAASSKGGNESENPFQEGRGGRGASSQGQGYSTIGDFAQSAAGRVKETASNAFETIAGGSGSGRGMSAGYGAKQYDATPSSSVYIGNLFFDVREEDLRKKFEGCGTIESVKLIMDNRGLSKGFGYINFATTPAATQAIETFNNEPFEGRPLTVQYATPRTPLLARPNRNPAGASPPTRTLFIGNMAFDMSDRELNNLFRDIRNVVDVRVAIDRRTGQPRGFAHADFTDVESAKEAMVALSGKEVCGRALRVDYSQSTGRGVRRDEGGAGGAGGMGEGREEMQRGY
ncbi:hypothetical protein XPA_009970 [Xanthoria parietina]